MGNSFQEISITRLRKVAKSGTGLLNVGFGNGTGAGKCSGCEQSLDDGLGIRIGDAESFQRVHGFGVPQYDEGQGHTALAKIGSRRFPGLGGVSLVVEKVIHDLEREAEVVTVSTQSGDLICVRPGYQAANPTACLDE